MSPPPVADVVLGTLETPRGQTLALTGDDALWLARALVGEAGPDAADGPEGLAIASTMLRRWSVVNDARAARGQPALWPTFAALLMAYCQPINPDWARRGSPEQQARRARITSMPWSDIPPRIRELALGVLSGRERLTARPAVDFAAASLVEDRVRGNALLARVTVPGAHNAFMSDSQSRAAREPRVRGHAPPMGPVLAALALVFVTLAIARLTGVL